MVIEIGEVIILEKQKANHLLSMGFKYIERIIHNRKAYVFIQTPELMKALTSHYDASSFFINKNVCF